MMEDKVARKIAKIFHLPLEGIAGLKDLITVEATEEAIVVEVNSSTRDASEHNQQTLIKLMYDFVSINPINLLIVFRQLLFKITV